MTFCLAQPISMHGVDGGFIMPPVKRGKLSSLSSAYQSPMLRAATLFLLATTIHARQLKGSKDSADTCNLLQGVPVYDEHGGYAEYGNFTASTSGEEKVMTYANLIQEFADYLAAVRGTDPTADLNANQPYDNLHITYSGTPSIIDPSKWVFLAIGPSFLFLFFEPKAGGGEEDLGQTNFLNWHLGPSRYDILAEDPTLMDNEAITKADIYTQTSVSSGYLSFFRNLKFKVKVNKCKISDPFSRLAKSDAVDISDAEKYQFSAHSSLFVLIPPGLKTNVYESLGEYKFANFFPPNSFVPSDFVIEGTRYRPFCVGTPLWCEKELAKRRRLVDAEQGDVRRLHLGAVGHEIYELDF